MLSIELYKQNKLEFLKLAKNAHSDDRNFFIYSITPEAIGNYQNLIIFIEDLESIDFLVDTAFGVRVRFIDQSIKILAEAYKHNKIEYDNFIQQTVSSDKVIFNEGKILEPDLYVLRSFLFGSKHVFTEKELESINALLNQYNSYFIKPYMWKTEYEIYYGQYAPYLIEQNSKFAEYMLSVKSAWKFKSDDEAQAVREVFTNSNTLSRTIKLSHLGLELSKTTKTVGTQITDNGKSTVTSKYFLLEHNNATKKSLLIYGHDNEGAFPQSNLILNLFLEKHNVLVLDARNKFITLQDIAKSIQNTGFQDLDEIYIMMHGRPTKFSIDVELYLSVGLPSVKASNLFKLIVQETNNQPIKAVIYSCHSQLITHKIANILPKDSEVITLSEDQVIDGRQYALNTFVSLSMAFNDLISQEDLRKTATKTDYYFKQNCDCGKMPSYTDIKIGTCNFRTPVNLAKQDLIDLLSKTSKAEVASKVSNYLGNGTNEEDIREDTNNLFDMVESNTDTYPLLNYREQTETNGNFNKYLGVAGAIYAIYDQCSEGYIADSDFTPIEDSMMASILEYYAENQAAINTVLAISTLLNYMLLND